MLDSCRTRNLRYTKAYATVLLTLLNQILYVSADRL